MTEPPKKRRGRPPRDPSSAGSAANFHLGLRLSEVRGEQLRQLVELANERARAARVPANVTPSSLVTLWILERIDVELAIHEKRKKK